MQWCFIVLPHLSDVSADWHLIHCLLPLSQKPSWTLSWCLQINLTETDSSSLWSRKGFQTPESPCWVQQHCSPHSTVPLGPPSASGCWGTYIQVCPRCWVWCTLWQRDGEAEKAVFNAYCKYYCFQSYITESVDHPLPATVWQERDEAQQGFRELPMEDLQNLPPCEYLNALASSHVTKRKWSTQAIFNHPFLYSGPHWPLHLTNACYIIFRKFCEDSSMKSRNILSWRKST